MVAFCNLAGAFGGAIAYGVGHVNGHGGLQGFRWLFIIEGVITLLSAIPLWLCLPDYPARAKFLNEEDKRFAEDRLKERGGGYNRDHASRKEVLATFTSPRMLAHYIAYVSAELTFTPTFFELTLFLTDRRRCTSRIVHILYTYHCERTRLYIDSCPATHRPTLVHRLRRCHHPQLLRRPLQCPRDAHNYRIYNRRSGLVDRCTLTPRRVR